MRVDSNTSGHRQWFYFSMKNEKKCRVTLHIYRFKKMYSLFQRGMRPFVRSRKSGKAWRPGGDNVQYRYERQRNEYGVKKEVKSFVLSLSFNFEHENDEVFMAAGIPYSYTFLQKQLLSYKQQVDKRQNLNFQTTVLGRSMCGLDIPLLTVEHKMCKLVHADKKQRFIIINARTHSGQASSSWVLDGLLHQLGQSDEVDSWMLSENICLKITPMLNPDGVFIGNYRTGIVGEDFNRKFHSGKREFFPEIFALKRLVRQCRKEGTVQLFFDLHGHSILKNSFIYGPSQEYSSKFAMNNLPVLLLHNSKYFRFSSCKFQSEKENAETARIYFQLKEDILTFTCENSLGLYQNQSQTFQMLAGDWQVFGQSIIHSMIQTFKNRDIHIPQTSPSKQKQRSPHKQKQGSTKSNFTSEIQKKIGLDEPKLKIQTTKNSKKERIYFKIPSVHKNMSQNEALDLNFSYSQQIQRDDDYLQPKQFSFNEKMGRQDSREGKPVNVRRKSEVMKAPTSNLVHRIIGKTKLEQLQRKNTEEEQAWMGLGRSSTYDTSQTLQREINRLHKQQEEVENDQCEMEPIDENFSDDYVSMNDLDSQGEDLPEQEKNYLFEYIKSNQHRVKSNEEEEDSLRTSEKQEASKAKDVDAKISRFREIRFKSIEEIYETDPAKQLVRINAKKPKLQPHKFKDNVSKSLIYKYNDMLSHSEFDDPSLIAFSQQKQLNERNHRRTQKDPFILFQRKDKEKQ